jgi:hypothetical protein
MAAGRRQEGEDFTLFRMRLKAEALKRKVAGRGRLVTSYVPPKNPKKVRAQLDYLLSRGVISQKEYDSCFKK